MRGLVWFKKDLRSFDHYALHAAAKACDEVIAIYFIDPYMQNQHGISLRQRNFILAGLKHLQTDLPALGIPLAIIKKDTEDIPTYLLQFAQRYQIQTLYYNREYEVDEKKRDVAVTNLLENNQVKVFCYDDQLILPPQYAVKKDGKYFQIFTPFMRHWLEQFYQWGPNTLLSKPRVKKLLPNNFFKSTLHLNQFPTEDAKWPSGHQAARKRLKAFVDENLAQYNKTRDFPALESTSQLSPYLATGMISARECFLQALKANHDKLSSGQTGALTWMRELIWREFYKLIVIAQPRVCMYKPYQLITESLPWVEDNNLLQAWQQGRTGYPLVDAGMRQLNKTGWMHNRLRMVTAMFLSKNLFLDWRLGERYFTEQLIDIDFSANNGGWQWCASTGCDAVPYFRVFNPLLQSKRYDPDGTFIRKFIPELSSFPSPSIHEPYKNASLFAKQMGYPSPIVDYKTSRAKVLKLFKLAKRS